MIPMVTVLIAGVGIVFLAVLFSRIHAVNDERKLKNHRDHEYCLSWVRVFSRKGVARAA